MITAQTFLPLNCIGTWLNPEKFQPGGNTLESSTTFHPEIQKLSLDRGENS
jgi:hypothetical protein